MEPPVAIVQPPVITRVEIADVAAPTVRADAVVLPSAGNFGILPRVDSIETDVEVELKPAQ